MHTPERITRRRSLTLTPLVPLTIALVACTPTATGGASTPEPAPSTPASVAPPSADPATPTPQPQENSAMRIRLIIGDNVATATLFDNPTARDFASLLPVTVSMHDLFGREKPGPLPRALDTSGERVFTYTTGDISYWSPNNDIAIFYAGDGTGSIPSPGLIRLGVIDEGGDIFATAGDAFELTIEAAA